MRFFLAVLVGLFFVRAYAQRYHYTEYTVEDGLAQSQVKDICQDDQGYLWIATNSGLSRFDGIEFVNYSIQDGLPDNKVRKIYKSENGDLWAVTPVGVAHFRNNIITPYLFEETYRINDLIEFNGDILFGSDKGLLRLEEGAFELIGSPDINNYYIRSLVNYRDSILVMGARSGVYVYEREDFKALSIPGYEDLNVKNLTGYKDEVYVSARRIGLFSYHLINGDTRQFELDYTTVSSVVVEENEIFGISSNRGAFLIREEEVVYFNSDNGLISSNQINDGNSLECIFKDSEGNVWLGTDGNGLLKFSGQSVVSYSIQDGLNSNLILAITQDNDGDFIYGTYDAGLTWFNSDTANHFSSGAGVIADNTVWVVKQDSLNRSWVGTSRGLTILGEGGSMYSNPLEGVEIKIRSIVTMKNGDVLTGGSKGIWVIRGDSVFNVHSDMDINKFHILKGEVFAATAEGLLKFSSSDDYASYEQIKLPVDQVNSLTSDFYGNLWAGTDNGLFVIRSENQIYTFLLDEKNYRSKTILGLITGRDSSVWVSGMNGVYQISPEDVENQTYKIYNYGSSEGLIDEECNINALYEDTDGNLWVGTANGPARIDPNLNNRLFDYEPPVLHVTGIRLFMESFKYDKYDVEMNPVFGVPTYIELPHNRNHLTFDFIGINFKNPKSVRYEYRLIGVNDSWSPVSKSNYATYSYLQPGEYDFEVRALNKSGLFSNLETIRIVIQPPFWRTWWFFSLAIIGVFIIIVLIFQARIRVLKQRQENEKLGLKNRLLFLEQRSLNASMNRHFIFNSLNSIQYFINSSDRLSANKYLSNFAKLIRKNLDSSAANNFIVTLQEEIERIELYLSLEKMRFSGKFEYEVSVSSSLDTESIEIPSMILQPFVENSIIHGVLSLDGGGQIKVDIYEEFGEVIFVVEDNGLGIDNSLKSKQISVEGDHESKGVEITNRRIELLRKLTGENLLIVGPFQMNSEEGESLGTKVILKLGGAQKFE